MSHYAYEASHSLFDFNRALLLFMFNSHASAVVYPLSFRLSFQRQDFEILNSRHISENLTWSTDTPPEKKPDSFNSQEKYPRNDQYKARKPHIQDLIETYFKTNTIFVQILRILLTH